MLDFLSRNIKDEDTVKSINDTKTTLEQDVFNALFNKDR